MGDENTDGELYTGQAVHNAASKLDSLFGGDVDRMFPVDASDSEGQPAPADDNTDSDPPPPAEEPETEDEPSEPEVGDDGGAQEEEQPTEDPQDYLQTLAELAEAHDASLEDLLQLKHKVKAAGKEREVTLQDLVRGFQQGTDYAEKTTRLAEQRRQFDADERARTEHFQQQMGELAQRFNAAETFLQHAFHNPELEALKVEDPGQWAVQRQQLQEQWAQLQQQKQLAQHQAQIHQHQQMQQFLEREKTRLMEYVPAWNKAAERSVEAVARELGFSDQEIQAAGHSAAMTRALYELATLRAEKSLQSKTKEAAKKRVKTLKKTIPRIASAGKGSSQRRNGHQQTAKARSVKQTRGQLKKSGRLADGARAIAALNPNWGT